MLLYTSAAAEQLATKHSVVQGGCRPHRSHYRTSQAAAAVKSSGRGLMSISVFDGVLFEAIKIFCLFEKKQQQKNRHYYYKGNGDEMEICLQ